MNPQTAGGNKPGKLFDARRFHAPFDFDDRPVSFRALVRTLRRPARSQLGPLCTTDTTPADQQIDACNKILALKVFSGEKLATIYFWRAVGWNKKGN